ncbi:hypothetical protein [Synechococcus sp. J7-Johnson]|uniref:hypothetical protein n=1 Tax=Synechococcus sp. J7-Johnson TaxID=2823737 RepID=UPI0020CE9654|nr:hypothetical protein [Synechococcus sp. J7-Johnson]
MIWPVLLGDRLEIGSEIDRHAAYLGHWIGLLKDSPKVMLQVLSEARQAADLICPELATAEPQPAAAEPMRGRHSTQWPPAFWKWKTPKEDPTATTGRCSSDNVAG